MALSSQAEARQDSQYSEKKLLDVQNPHPTELKGFVPNPDAKPFIPAGKPVVGSTKALQGNFIQDGNLVTMEADISQIFEAARQYGGILLDSFTSDVLTLGIQEGPNAPFPQESHDPRSIAFADFRKPLKKHIAYHLLSNVLDDEIQEDHLKEDSLIQGRDFGADRESNVRDSSIQRPRKVQDPIGVSRKSPSNLDVHERDAVDSWPVGVLALDANSNLRQPSSLGSRRSLQEIWSPGPSPQSSFSSSPSDDVFNFSHKSCPADVGQLAFPSSREVTAYLSGSPSPPMSTTPSSAFSSENFDHLREHVGDQDFVVGLEMDEFSACRALPGAFFGAGVLSQNCASFNQFVIPEQLHFSPPFSAYAGCASVEAMKCAFADVGARSSNADVFLPNGEACVLDAVSYSRDDADVDLDSCANEPVSPEAQQPSPASSDEACPSGHWVPQLQVQFKDGPSNNRNCLPRRGVARQTRSASSCNAHRRSETVSCVEQLGHVLDSCLDQLRCLEKECKKAELELSKIHPTRRSSLNNSAALSKLPANPTRVDKMIAEQLKEHHGVESLIGRVERVGSMPLHPNVGVALDRWLACIRELQTLRREELSTLPRQQSGNKSYREKDLLAMSRCVKTLNSHTRSARTIVWCAMQMLHADRRCFSRSASCSSLESRSDRLSSNS